MNFGKNFSTLFLLLLFGCSTNPDSTSLHHPWLAPYEGELDEADVHHLNPESFFPVSNDYLEQTVRLLAKHSIIEISQADARLFSGGSYVSSPGSGAYLVRGVAFDSLAGGYQPLLIKNGMTTLIVFFGAMGPGPSQLRSQPVVFSLNEKTDQIALEWSTMQ
jgi:hypothetical protein